MLSVVGDHLRVAPPIQPDSPVEQAGVKWQNIPTWTSWRPKRRAMLVEEISCSLAQL